MNKRLFALAAAAVLAVAGTFAILAYVRDADDRAQADTELVEVYVVRNSVEAGTDAAGLRRSIDTELVPASNVVAGVITDLTQLDGRVAAVDLVPGEQVLIGRLIEETAYDDGRTSLVTVPVGMLEITISLDPERVVGGQIIPGDTVAVIGSFEPLPVGGLDVDNPDDEEISQAVGDALKDGTAVIDLSALLGDGDSIITAQVGRTTHTLLNKILVTRIQLERFPQEQTDADGNPVDASILAPTGNLLVTLALDAHQVEQLVFAAEFGRIWLSYEPPEVDEADQSPITRDNVYGHPHEDEDPSIVGTANDSVSDTEVTEQ